MAGYHHSQAARTSVHRAAAGRPAKPAVAHHPATHKAAKPHRAKKATHSLRHATQVKAAKKPAVHVRKPVAVRSTRAATAKAKLVSARSFHAFAVTHSAGARVIE